MKRKVLSCLIAGTLLTTTLLTGCGSDSSTSGQGTSSSSDSSPSADATTEDASGEVTLDAGGDTITIWVPPFGSTDETDDEFWQRVLADVAQEVNATLKIETVPWENYEEKYLTGISGGTGPDIGYMYNEMLGSYINMGVLAELGSYFTTEDTADYLYYDYGNINGTQYTLPFVVGAPRILYCNMDLLATAGYDEVPSTWAELEEIALAVEDATDATGFTQYWGGYFGDLAEIYYPYLWQAGGDIFDSEGNFIANSPEGVEAAEWVYSLKEKGILTDSVTAMNATAVSDAFKSGDLAMFVSSTTSATKIDEAGINWGFTPFISYEEGSQGYTFLAVDALVMLDSTKHKEETAAILKAMTSPSVMEEFHQQRYAMPPINASEGYYDNVNFEAMYEESINNFKALPVVENSSQVYNALFSNLQRMMMGEITAQEALDDTAAYAESVK
ncbi:MAG: sugar ABC transporter substrate-binding protein [Eubacteriales bacterium]